MSANEREEHIHYLKLLLRWGSVCQPEIRDAIKFAISELEAHSDTQSQTEQKTLREGEERIGNVCCSECDKPTFEFFRTFFVDKRGMRRYGGICPKCYKEKSD